ncbi:L-alanine-DL-glutamate epimerase-like enolase superfamily enzyme [Rhodoligotrophos appendicifer]|uniref:mandelate racemase/muconate lactonizing enzyme family protein n=1 Tax=Rhodoligotrophos appendicifer TaxID=987056 RepID=UPI001186609D|nr:mandelate racemase/muconate lactonizing enzyme family protein [Rhodoligotrophos appendicifer]
MKITDIEVTHHRLPLDPPFNASWDTRPRTQFSATIVRVHTDSGLTGIGSGDEMIGFEAYKPLFIGQDALSLERHFRILENIQFHGSRCWPLDLALWDLAGKAANQPVWRLLGGASGRIRAYASSGTLRQPQALADQAERFLEQGFPALKIRFHRGDWRDDIKALEAVRARLGNRLELMVDCNQGWRMPWDAAPPWTLKEALPVARALEDLDVFWMEEPLHRGDVKGMAALRSRVDIRIAGAEMTRELHELRSLIEARALDVLQPDAALVGGISGLRRIATQAVDAGLIFTPHTWTNGLGVLANAHLTAALGNAPFLEYPYDPPEWPLAARDFMLAEPLQAHKGWLDLGTRPGLGIALDEERLNQTRVA